MRVRPFFDWHLAWQTAVYFVLLVCAAFWIGILALMLLAGTSPLGS